MSKFVQRKKNNMKFPLLLLLLPPLFLLILSCSALSDQQRKVYVVYLGEHKGLKTSEEILDDHHSLLLSVKNSKEEALDSVVYSYKHTINGFAALLTEEEARKLSKMEGVVSAFPSEGRLSPHTTRSWQFIMQEEGFKIFDSTDWVQKPKKDVIIGMLDSGIWPESESFSDRGMSRSPKHWRGICQEGDAFNSSHCNMKVIGARFYVKAYEAYHGALNRSTAFRSPRDNDGHGTHTASTVAGRAVAGVSALGGFARGTASGGAPFARLAVYKVCWPIPGPNPNLENTCFDADMLAAFDDAVADGVDVVSVSIGAVGAPAHFANDGIAIGALHAARRGIVVSCSAGNSGPMLSTVTNLAPWMITVAASSIDRAFDSPVLLGNGVSIMGQTVTPYTLKSSVSYPLIFAGDAVVPGTPANVSGQCLPNSLDAKKVKGKIVTCLRGAGLRVAKGLEVKRAGGAAIILGNSVPNGNEIPVDAHVLAGTAISSDGAIALLEYINSSSNPTAKIAPARTVLQVSPAPVIAGFSSRGPNRIAPNLLKPDVAAPGLNILAAWSGSSSPTKLEDDRRRVKYNIYSGTSMACPHVSAVAALLKSIHPKWSEAAIRSAIMTTATSEDSLGNPLTDASGQIAGPLVYGSGHIRPEHALDPGLVYDASYEDYLLFACANAGAASLDPAFRCPTNTNEYPFALNYPSIAVGTLYAPVTIKRTVTNVGNGSALYRVSVVEPKDVAVEVVPTVLKFKKIRQKKRFTVTLSARGRFNVDYEEGSYTCDTSCRVIANLKPAKLWIFSLLQYFLFLFKVAKIP
ncbi:subtilisin-like protease SBT5.6 isoform X2 [Zingiber officinale]|uniref:subtilisin-like protease SBT5.6 isoform X2 n=1 Tax=Zingiber officinale TaxID=94328 RepID=UPI001C4C716A|nr:subtilisin-like protease SBT5.6 isoform X2 [Zingiber officinale]XP_042416369.1 subtilisin-like protease SBT5.6 isoform X2 [Zingiber officinale]